MLFNLRANAQIFLLLVLWCSGASAASAVSILPTTQAVSLLVKEVTDERHVPLLSANVSPHDFSLRPSHIRRLQAAQLVVWLGPKLEPYLAKVMLQIPEHKQLIINQGLWVAKYGQHPWTSPKYLLKGMQQLAQYLDKVWDSTSWLQQMHYLQQQILLHSQSLTKKQQGYLVYHDGISGFEAYFGLSHLASFTDADDQPPGAKQLAIIAQLAKQEKVACILTDHEVKPRLVDAVLKAGIKRIPIDILATNSGSLSGYMTQLEQALLSCSQA
tara:strand:+ start:185 stop:997 length:813 start_codon:yes stop_codon:yes gene_type:complete